MSNTDEKNKKRSIITDEIPACAVCGLPIEEDIRYNDNTTLARCKNCNEKYKLIYTDIIPKAIKVNIKEEIVLMFTCSHCNRMVALFKDDCPELHVSCIGPDTMMVLCNICHKEIYNIYARNNVITNPKYKWIWIN